MPSMFCSGGVDCRGSRLGWRVDGVRRDSRSLTQERQGGAVAAHSAAEETGLTLDQLHMLRRRSGELGPVELQFQRVKDIVVDRAGVS